MNIAFPTLLIALFILPGLFFTLAFYNADNEQPSYISLTHKTVLSLFTTVCLHLVGLLVVTKIFKQPIDLQKFLILISGDHSKLYNSFLESITNSEIIFFLIYFLVLYMSAFIIGKIFRWVIDALKLDRKFKFLQINTPWYYLFTASGWSDGKPDGIMISALIELAGQGYLYQGRSYALTTI